MMKSLVRELPFGKATAKVTVAMFTEKKYMDGIDIGIEEVITTRNIEIVLNGSVVASGHHVDVLEFNEITDTYYQSRKMDVTKKYTKVGDRALTVGEEAGVAIKNAMVEMETELSKEFGVETEAEKQQKEELEEAQAIVTQAKKEGIENLLTEIQLKEWRTKYNNIHNEGGEGYIPTRVSKEQYQHALNVIGV